MKTASIYCVLLIFLLADKTSLADTIPTKAVTSAPKNSYFSFKNNIKIGGYAKNFLSPNIPLPPRPIFWYDKFAVDSAYFIGYERLLYHTRKFFGLYLGGQITPLTYRNSVNVATAAYLSLRFYCIEIFSLTPYLHYTIAGPTYLSQNPWGRAHFSNNFVFQDTIGLAVTLAPKIPIDIGFSVIHYSNGDIFPRNSGIQVPFTLWISYAF